jgi:hypothetical protein
MAKDENTFFPLPYELYFVFNTEAENASFELLSPRGQIELSGKRIKR